MQTLEYILESLPTIIPLFCAALAVPAFGVSIITQLIKNLPYLKNLPTSALVLALSIAAAMFIFAGAVQYGIISFSWFLLCASFVLGFFIAYVAINGWRELHALWQRFSGKNS